MLSITQIRRVLAHIAAGVLACALVVIPAAVLAFEAELTTRPADSALRKSLVNASQVFAARKDGLTDPQDILAAAQSDYARLIASLYEKGYFGPVIRISVDGREAADISPLAQLTKVDVVKITVDPGKLFVFGTATVSPLPEGFVPQAVMSKAARASTSAVRAATNEAVDAWRNAGYAKARIGAQRIVANHKDTTLNVAVEIDPGPLTRFGAAQISTPSNVRQKRIDEIASIPTGSRFNPVVLDRSAQRLRETGAFRSVTLKEAEALGPGDILDIDIQVADAKPRRIGAGAELQSLEGLTVSGFWMHRNLAGGAERFRVEAEVSGLFAQNDGLDYLLRTSLTRPSTFAPENDLNLLLELEQLDEPLYYSQRAQADVWINRYLSDRLSADGGLTLRYSDVQDAIGSREFFHAGVPLAAKWDRRDDMLNPKNGFYLDAELDGLIGLNGSKSLVRGYLDARAYRGFGPDERVVLAGRLQFGAIAGAQMADTPPDLLFLSGGSGTVRGHDYQSLSIPLGAGSSGGRSFLGLAGELRVDVTDTISAVAFYDAGYVGASTLPDGSGSWHSGAGLGVRYQTGIGPIRLDLAIPVTGASSNNLQFYVGIGQAF